MPNGLFFIGSGYGGLENTGGWVVWGWCCRCGERFQNQVASQIRGGTTFPEIQDLHVEISCWGLITIHRLDFEKVYGY